MPIKLLMFKPEIPPVIARVPVTVKLPTLALAILVEANVLAPVKMLVFAKYAMLEVPESWLIEIPETVPVTLRLPMLAEAILLEAKVFEPVNMLLFAKYASDDVPAN